MKKFKCLVANDEPTQLLIIAFIFRQCGFEVITAQNGYEAYHKVLVSIKEERELIAKNGNASKS